MGLWSFFKNTLVGVAAYLNIYSTEVCYNADGIGCFSNEEPFNNAAGKLPKSPEDIGVSFLLYTRENQDFYQLLTKDEVDIKRSYFNGTKATKFIIHGYRDDGRDTWVRAMKNEFLIKEDANVIAVDWEKGADTPAYNQAAANTRVVGALIAQLIVALFKTSRVLYSDVHLIGHSLGAHIAGYAGERVKGIGRITGLDPAGPAFGDDFPSVRLDPTDAHFVDVIHTDGQPLLTLGFGTSEKLGHADFYPNGGKDQPGCQSTGKHIFEFITGKFRKFAKGIACDHARSRDYFIESINSACKFVANPCKSYEAFELGSCPCRRRCANMGYPAADGRKPFGSFYLKTNSKAPFCK